MLQKYPETSKNILYFVAEFAFFCIAIQTNTTPPKDLPAGNPIFVTRTRAHSGVQRAGKDINKGRLI